MASCADDIGKYCGGRNGSVTRYCLLENAAKLSGQCRESAKAAEAAALKNTLGTPYCFKSPVCDPAPDRGGNRLGVKAVQWKQTMGYTFTYPFASPEGERYGSSIRVTCSLPISSCSFSSMVARIGSISRSHRRSTARTVKTASTS